MHQIDTFYNGLNQTDQDSLNNAAGGNLLNRTPRDALAIIENKSKVRTSRGKSVVSQVNATSSRSSPVNNSSTDAKIDKLTDAIQALVIVNQKKVTFTQTPTHGEVKKVEVCVTCGGPHAYYNCTTTDGSPFEANDIAGTSNQVGNQYRPQNEPNYRANTYQGPPGFNQNHNMQNPNQNQPRMNQGYQNQGNFYPGPNQGFQHQGNLN